MGHERHKASMILICLVVVAAGKIEIREIEFDRPEHDEVRIYQEIARPRKAAVTVSGSLSAPSSVISVTPGARVTG